MNKIVLFSQEVCMPCKMVKQFLEMNEYVVDKEFEVGVDIGSEEAMDVYDVMRTPTMILFDENNKEIKRTSGYVPDDIEEIFDMK